MKCVSDAQLKMGLKKLYAPEANILNIISFHRHGLQEALMTPAKSKGGIYTKTNSILLWKNSNMKALQRVSQCRISTKRKLMSPSGTSKRPFTFKCNTNLVNLQPHESRKTENNHQADLRGKINKS